MSPMPSGVRIDATPEQLSTIKYDTAGLVAAIAQVSFPTIELHVSNPARRGVVSDIAKACHGTLAGFGVYGYHMALRVLQELKK